MMRTMTGVLMLLVAVLAIGCGGLKYMDEAKGPHSLAADAQMSTVVFIRPSGYAGRQTYAILDQSGRLLGEVNGNSYFIAKMPPGEYMFISWGEGTPALKATVEPGKIYYVEVGVTIGAWAARGRLFAIGPRRKQWSELPEWLGDSNLLLPKPNALELFSADRGEDVSEVVQKGIDNYGEYDAEAKDLRTLLPSDGVDVPVSPQD